MDNPFEKKLTFSCDYREAEKFMAEHLGIPNLEIWESDNDTTHGYSVGKDHDFFDEDCLDEARENGNIEYYRVGGILQDMFEKGKIEEGTYYIKVSW